MPMLYSSHSLGVTGSFLALDLDLDLDRDRDRDLCPGGMRLLLAMAANPKKGFIFSDSAIGFTGLLRRLECLILGERVTLRDRGKILAAGGGSGRSLDLWFWHPRLF